MSFEQSFKKESSGATLPDRMQSIRVSGNGQSQAHAERIADILSRIGVDEQGQAAGYIHGLGPLTEDELSRVESILDAEAIQLCNAVNHIAQLSDMLAPGYPDPVNSVTGNEENLRKMLIIMVDDARVVVIFLASQLSRLRSMEDRPGQLHEYHAGLVLDIYAPLANRLGIEPLKWELEDCAFRHLNPRMYQALARTLEEKRHIREQYIVDLTDRIVGLLGARQIESRIQGRPKHIYSIWRKMQGKGLEFSQLKDILAVRVLVNSVEDCYRALSVIHEEWHHDKHEFSDYITMPKANGYQSIHTVISGPGDKTVEVQIRTFAMHEESELGFAAHWRYKETKKYDSNFDQKLIWLRQLLEWKNEALASPARIAPAIDSTVDADAVKTGTPAPGRRQNSRQVYVFTPKGMIIVLPEGATPIDFAYAIHSEVGNRTRGARVNGKMVSLNYLLQTGDQVSIQTVKTGGPSRDWLRPESGYVRTRRARNRIRQWHKRTEYDQNVPKGRVSKLLYPFRKHGEDDPDRIPVKSKTGSDDPAKGGFTVSGVDNLLTHIAKCCTPVPGDDIIGFITSGRGVTIHRKGCNNISRIKGELRARLIEVDWGREENSG